MIERIAKVGYINEDCQHILVSIYNPALLNPGSDWVQVAITIEGAITLRDNLDAILVGRYEPSAEDNAIVSLRNENGRLLALLREVIALARGTE